MQPESISSLTRLIQRSNIDTSLGRPLGARIAAKNTSCSKRWWYSRITEICNSSREPKWAKTPDLLMPVTSASAPIDRPSNPIWAARGRAASRIEARVC
jgi:hypothetical protein